MARKSTRQQVPLGIAGQHLALPVAAHLARTQLVPDSLQPYDAEHLNDRINAIGTALARTATLYVTDLQGGPPRPLLPGEVEGATAKHAATQLVLKDGRALAGVTIRRADLRQAIAVLKAAALAELAAKPAATPPPAARNDAASLREHLMEIERLLTPPLIASQVQRAKAEALWIARHASQGRVANLAMQLMSALHEPQLNDDLPGGYRVALAGLRAVLEEASVE